MFIWKCIIFVIKFPDIISNGTYFHNNSHHSFLKSAAEWKNICTKLDIIAKKQGLLYTLQENTLHVPDNRQWLVCFIIFFCCKTFLKMLMKETTFLPLHSLYRKYFFLRRLIISATVIYARLHVKNQVQHQVLANKCISL